MRLLCLRRTSSSFSSVCGNMLNSALWSRQARMNNTTGCRGSAAPSTKGCSAVKKKKSRRAEAHRARHRLLNKKPRVHPTFLFLFFFSPPFKRRLETRNTSAAAAPARRKMNMQTSFKKLHATVCINTKPSASKAANASRLASSFQSNCVRGKISKYVTHEPESRRRLLIKYAKLYLSTEV